MLAQTARRGMASRQRRGGEFMSTRSDRGGARQANPGVLALILLSVSLAACDGVLSGSGKGTVAGEVVLGTPDVRQSSAEGLNRAQASERADAPFVPGELIVAFEPTLAGATASR